MELPPSVAPRRTRRDRKTLAAWVWVVGVCLAAMVGTYVLFVEPPPPRKLVIASGGQTGAYYHFARRYAAELARDGITLEVRETAGSVENLELLGDPNSGVAVAIVQGGVAGPQHLPQFLALGSLYREPLWVFYRGEHPVSRLGELEGRRVGVGLDGSGTQAVALRMLQVNGLLNPGTPAEKPRVTLVREGVDATATALQNGTLDVAFFVAAFEAEYIQRLLHDHRVRLLHFDQHEAYRRQFRFLAPVTLPEGLVDLGRNVPPDDVSLLAPTAMLVVRKDFHPALVPLLLATATRLHGDGDELSEPGEFPSESYCDFPLSDDARRFFRSGQPVLQRLLPFWLASLVDRAKVMLIPLVMLTMPLMRVAPPLMRWRSRRKIYIWYSELRALDQRLSAGIPDSEIDGELARLRGIEHQLAFLDVPLSYMEECYHLRLHLGMIQQRLLGLRGRSDALS